MSKIDPERRFLGASIIAGIIFWLLNFVSGLLFESETTTSWDFWSATIKAPIFAVVFHYIHNWVANFMKWYQ